MLVGRLREWLWAEGLLRSVLAAGKDPDHADNAKFRDYFDYDEPIHRVPSHRALAVFRGRSLEILDAKLVLAEEPPMVKPVGAKAAPAASLAEGHIAVHLGLGPRPAPGRRADPQDRRLDLEGQAEPQPGA